MGRFQSGFSRAGRGTGGRALLTQQGALSSVVSRLPFTRRRLFLRSRVRRVEGRGQMDQVTHTSLLTVRPERSRTSRQRFGSPERATVRHVVFGRSRLGGGSDARDNSPRHLFRHYIVARRGGGGDKRRRGH